MQMANSQANADVQLSNNIKHARTNKENQKKEI